MSTATATATSQAEQTPVATGVKATPRVRLAAIARKAKMTVADMKAIATALFPDYDGTGELTDGQLEQVVLGCQLLARSGVGPGETAMIVDHYRQRVEGNWRLKFWEARMAAARARAQLGIDETELMAIMEEG